MSQSFPVILMVVFTCSQSFAMLPHESSSWQREVEMAAEQDANHDTNQCLWFTAGLGTSAACLFGGYIAFIVAHGITSSQSDYLYHDTLPSMADECLGVPVASAGSIRFLATIGGASACGGLSFLDIYVAQSNPSAERFIGKSPEYVESYMAAYTSKARSLRIQSAAAGTATGCGILLWLISKVFSGIGGPTAD